jgi:hypothetical protein
MPCSLGCPECSYFDIKVTEETNTKQEKEQYIREAFDSTRRSLDTTRRGPGRLKKSRR